MQDSDKNLENPEIRHKLVRNQIEPQKAPSISEYPKPPERKKRTGIRGPN